MRGRVRGRASGEGRAESTASGENQEALQPGDLAHPRSLPPARAPRARGRDPEKSASQKGSLTRQLFQRCQRSRGRSVLGPPRAKARSARRGAARGAACGEAAPPAAPRATRRGGPRRRCPQPSRALRPGWNAPRSTDGGEDRGRRGKRPLPGICSGKSKSDSKKCGLSAPWSSWSNTPLAFCTSDPCVNATRSRAGRSPTDRGRRGQRPTTEPRGRTRTSPPIP